MLKKQKHKEKMVNKKELMDEIERDKKKKGQIIMKKLEQLESKRKETMEKHARELHKMIMKQEKNYQALLHNKKVLDDEKNEKNNYVLEYQLSLLGRANLKENSVTLNRLNA